MVKVFADDADMRIVQYDRHDERQAAIMLLGPTYPLYLDLRPIEAGQHAADYPKPGYVAYRRNIT